MAFAAKGRVLEAQLRLSLAESSLRIAASCPPSTHLPIPFTPFQATCMAELSVLLINQVSRALKTTKSETKSKDRIAQKMSQALQLINSSQQLWTKCPEARRAKLLYRSIRQQLDQ